MLRYSIRFAVVLLLFALTIPDVAAQRTDTGTGDTSTGIGGTTDSAGDMFNPDTVFSDVDRGETVGSTGSTGTGFSSLSQGNAGGGTGAAGGFGGGFGGFGGLGGLGGLFGGMNTGRGQSSQPAIRTRLRSAIPVATATRQGVQQSASQRFRTLATQPQLRGINVNMQGSTAVIQGVVGSQRDRRMSELLMRLEPGVRSVDNQITVQQP